MSRFPRVSRKSIKTLEYGETQLVYTRVDGSVDAMLRFDSTPTRNKLARG